MPIPPGPMSPIMSFSFAPKAERDGAREVAAPTTMPVRWMNCRRLRRFMRVFYANKEGQNNTVFRHLNGLTGAPNWCLSRPHARRHFENASRENGQLVNRARRGERIWIWR